MREGVTVGAKAEMMRTAHPVRPVRTLAAIDDAAGRVVLD
jgi:hypothetical protein